MSIVVVVGWQSMLGKKIVEHLRRANYRVILAGRSFDSDIVFDLEQEFSLEFCGNLKADILIHCASSFGNDELLGAFKNFQINALGCINVLKLINQLSCKQCFYIGSVTSYDDFDGAGLNSYGLSKAQGEEILHWGMKKIGGTFCSLRFTGLYDVEGDCCRHQPWFGRIVAYASRGLDLNLPPSLGKRNYLHVLDAAKLVVKSLKIGLEGVWPVCCPHSLDHYQLAEIAYQEFNLGGRVYIDDKKQPFRKVIYPDSKEFYEKLQEDRFIDISQGLKMINNAGFSGTFGPMDVR